MLQSHAVESSVEKVRNAWYVEDDPNAFAPRTAAKAVTRVPCAAPTDAPTEAYVACVSELVAGRALL